MKKKPQITQKAAHWKSKKKCRIPLGHDYRVRNSSFDPGAWGISNPGPSAQRPSTCTLVAMGQEARYRRYTSDDGADHATWRHARHGTWDFDVEQCKRRAMGRRESAELIRATRDGRRLVKSRCCPTLAATPAPPQSGLPRSPVTRALDPLGTSWRCSLRGCCCEEARRTGLGAMGAVSSGWPWCFGCICPPCQGRRLGLW